MQDEPNNAAQFAVLFDMDGVLINTSGSYDEATRITVSDYLCSVLGLKAPCAKPDKAILRAMKQAGGFNNDWDLTRALILRIIHSLDLGPAPPSPDAWPDQMPNKSCAEVIEQSDLLSFAQDVDKAGGGYANALNLCNPEAESWLLGFGEVRGSNLVERIFQERYLGSTNFKEIYRTTPRYYEGSGLIEEEQPILDRSDLIELNSKVPFALVTGRPRKEAMIGLEQFNLRDLFEVVVGLDDALHGKPHPAPVMRALKRLGKPESFVYVGDMPDDLKAARAASAEMEIPVKVFGLCAERPEQVAEMVEAGFDEAFSNPRELAARLNELVSEE